MSVPPRDLVQALGMRGLVHQVTDDALGPLSAKEPITAYIGFDPSADSLPAGSLYPVMLLAHAAKAGHRPIAVMGGATGMIGDPTGKETERPLLSPEEILSNVRAIESQVRRIFANAGATVGWTARPSAPAAAEARRHTRRRDDVRADSSASTVLLPHRLSCRGLSACLASCSTQETAGTASPGPRGRRGRPCGSRAAAGPAKSRPVRDASVPLSA